jgi:hypothetical protein
MTIAMQWHGKHTLTAIEGLCFLRGVRREVILKTIGVTQAVVS